MPSLKKLHQFPTNGSSNHSSTQSLSTVFLYLILFFLPLRWLPGIKPIYLSSLVTLLLVGFITTQVFSVMRAEELTLAYIPLIVIALVLASVHLVNLYLTPFLIIISGVVSVFYFSSDSVHETRMFKFFTLWMTILSLYSLLVTYTAFSGFELSGAFYSGTFAGYSPTARWNHPNIVDNSFGFYGARSIYVLTEIAAVFAAVYAWKLRSVIFALSGAILMSQIFNIIRLTGSGRAGLMLPMVVIVMLVVKEKFIPYLVLSPLVAWILLVAFKNPVVQNPIFVEINEFTSGRIALYMDSVQVLINSDQALMGLGPNPWEEFTYAELGVTDQVYRFSNLTRPHNFALEFFIEYGLLVGGLLMYLCWGIARGAVDEIRQITTPTRFAVTIVLIGSIFVGIAVGGKVGPFPVNDGTMILWWLGLGYVIGTVQPD